VQHRFRVGTRRAVLSSALEIIKGLTDVIAVRVVMSKFYQMIVKPIGEKGFDRVTDPLVEHLAALDQQ
jgi:hypothetical protein